MKTRKKEKGITLIALVISIIVLLILAGVTIAALSGDNGILTRAKEAKEKTEQAQKDEEQTLSNMENILESYRFENINTNDTNPAGEMPSEATILENDANKGVVIKDQNENEWVWVEVPKTTVFADLTIDTAQELTEQNYNDIRDELIEYVGVYRNGSATQNRSDWKDEWYAMDRSTLVTASTENLTEQQKALKNGCGLTYDEYISTYKKMLKSVYTYGGFWIGRYEAGIEGTTTETTNARTSSSGRISIGTSPKAISKKDAIPYNYVYCSEAQALAQEMTPNNNYTSSLMFGIQWDLTCKFLETRGGLKTADINSDSSSWGNYNNARIENIASGKYAIYRNASLDKWINILDGYTKQNSENDYRTLLSTGITKYTNKMNIYDFAGNEWEWTLEKNLESNLTNTSRGGDYFSLGNMYSSSYRGAYNITYNSDGVSFRTTSYKK